MASRMSADGASSAAAAASASAASTPSSYSRQSDSQGVMPPSSNSAVSPLLATSAAAATATGGVIKGAPSMYVKLNVGGSLFNTTIGTLTKHDTMLRAMFSGRMEVLTDSEGWIMIDRSGKHFGSILNFLRDGNVFLPECRRELAELLAEAKYFCIEPLADACEKAMKNLKEPAETVVPIVRVPLITSPKEEQALIAANSTKPIVKLLINRHNNKYSYTGASDDNILKNIELFDKLSLRFSNRVLFIKDVIGSNEICCWSFYGHGKRIAEVCCTAIVYSPDRKNTKVEFPEARIYEETLNCLLYENRTGPDQELMDATSRVPPYISDDEESERQKGGSGGGGNGALGSGGGGAGGSGGSGGGGGGSGDRGDHGSSEQQRRGASGLSRLRSSKNNH